MCTHSVKLSLVTWTLLSLSSNIMASKNPKMNKQGTAGNSIQVTLTIPQKFEIIRTLEVVKARVWLWFHTKLDYQISII